MNKPFCEDQRETKITHPDVTEKIAEGIEANREEKAI